MWSDHFSWEKNRTLGFLSFLFVFPFLSLSHHFYIISGNDKSVPAGKSHSQLKDEIITPTELLAQSLLKCNFLAHQHVRDFWEGIFINHDVSWN